MVPTRVELLASDAALFGLFLFEQIQCKAAQGREVLCGIACAGAALVLTKANVHNPVHFVFHTPVAAHRTARVPMPKGKLAR